MFVRLTYYFLRPSKVWSILHDGSVKPFIKNVFDVVVVVVVVVVFHHKSCVFIFRNRMLTNQKRELTVSNCQQNCMLRHVDTHTASFACAKLSFARNMNGFYSAAWRFWNFLLGFDNSTKIISPVACLENWLVVWSSFWETKQPSHFKMHIHPRWHHTKSTTLK